MSQAQKKDLNYYLSRPDEMPTDPKEIERLANEHMEAVMEAGTEQLDIETIVGKADEPPGAAAANAEEKPNEPAPAKAEPEKEAKADPKAETPKDEAKPDGILAKDGKNVIPYSQLEHARQRAAEAEALARQQAEELATLRAAKAGEQPEPAADAEMLTDEELDALAEDSPTLAKTLRAQQAAILQLRDQVETVSKSHEAQAASQEAEVKSEIQAAIDGNPTLAEWQTAEDQTMWQRASGFDKVLRTMPEYANVSFADRFARVVELTQAALNQRPKVPAEDPPPPKQELTQAQIRAAAEAELAKASKARKPVSMSELPGGAPPPVDERQKVEEMSAAQIGNMLLGKSPEEIQAYLATL